jgi:hypothetical protein
VTPRDPAQSTPAGKAGDDFQKIAGIGAGIERRLHSADILTYHDLAARSPEEIAASLAGMAGLSAARIASQDWVGQARQLAGSTGPPCRPSLISTTPPSTSSFSSTWTTACVVRRCTTTSRVPTRPGQAGMRTGCSRFCAATYRPRPHGSLRKLPIRNPLLRRPRQSPRWLAPPENSGGRPTWPWAWLPLPCGSRTSVSPMRAEQAIA